MNIQFSGSLDEKQLRRAIGKQLNALIILGILFVTIALLTFVISISSAKNPTEIFNQPTFFILGFLGILFMVLPWISARRQFRTSKILGSPTTGSASEQALSISSKLGSAEIPWDSFYRSIVSKDIVMLYQSAYVFQVIPKEFFQAETDWTEFQNCVRSKVKPRKNRLMFALVIWIILVAIVLIILRFIPNA